MRRDARRLQRGRARRSYDELGTVLLDEGADAAALSAPHAATPEGWAKRARHEVAQLLRDLRG